MNDNQMYINVSGSAVYNAVKNYLNNNEMLKAEINKLVENLVNSGHVEQTAKRMVSEVLNGWRYKDVIERATEKAVNEVVKLQIKQIVEEQVKQALRNSVIVVPKVD